LKQAGKTTFPWLLTSLNLPANRLLKRQMTQQTFPHATTLRRNETPATSHAFKAQAKRTRTIRSFYVEFVAGWLETGFCPCQTTGEKPKPILPL
jgi:hypothetical protein